MSTVQIWVAALLTLACYSYLYKENVFFRLAEHTMIPIAVAHAIVTNYHSTFLPYCWRSRCLSAKRPNCKALTERSE